MLLGLVLGIIWSPCVGPTLGAALGLAGQGQNLAEVAVLMLCFGLGAGLPLVLLGSVSRTRMLAWRRRLMEAGKRGKQVLGVLLLALAVLILSGLDKRVETVLLDASPAWLQRLTTSI
jgi:cytochrome c biogenesis protein CcdA